MALYVMQRKSDGKYGVGWYTPKWGSGLQDVAPEEGPFPKWVLREHDAVNIRVYLTTEKPAKEER